jgi:hypothetical protein
VIGCFAAASATRWQQQNTRKEIFMKKLIVILVLFSLAFSDLAQQSAYALNFQRNFGFSSGSKVRGRFTMSVVGKLEDVKQVSFRIDGQEIAVVSEAPFRHQMHTDDFGMGWHELSAEVTLLDGSLQVTPTRRFDFVSPDDEFGEVGRIIIPLGGGVLLLTLLGIGSQFLFMRNRPRLAPGTARNYGFKGGTICKRCNRPFSIHFWALNLVMWVLDRCDYCGHWGLVQRRSIDELRAAEAAEKIAFSESGGSIPAGQAVLTPEEQLRRQLDDSRYTDH